MIDISKDIIKKAATGDIGAFEEIYRAFSSAVYTIALNITQNREDAEEAAQDAFVKVFKQLKSFKFESSFGTWVYRVAVNSAINIYNARARHRKRSAGLDEAADVADPASGLARERLDKEGLGLKAAGMLAHLSPEQRSCIVLRELEGLDYKEIAAALAIPLNTVRTRLKRARESLVKYCRKEGLGYGL